MTPFNKCSKNMMHPWCVLAYVLFMFVLFLYIDAPVALFFHHIELGSIQPLSEGVTISWHSNG